MDSDFGLMTTDSWGCYLDIPGFQSAIRPGTTMQCIPVPKEWIPSSDTLVWRFMDFKKFMSFIDSGALFFTRLDKLDDDSESAWSDATLRLLNGEARLTIQDSGWQLILCNEDTGEKLLLPRVQKPLDLAAEQVLEIIHSDVEDLEYWTVTENCICLRHKPTDYRFLIQDAKVVAQLGDVDSTIRAVQAAMHYAKLQSKSKLVNCWHVGEYESDAMWSRYTDRKDSIAIKTDVVSLVKSFRDRYPSAIGKVQYISFDKEVMPVPHLDIPYWFKRIQYNSDRELRVVMDETVYTSRYDNICTPDYSVEVCDIGLPYRIDPKVLIHEIVVGPGTDAWVVDLVRSIARQYGLDVPVVPSSLPK